MEADIFGSMQARAFEEAERRYTEVVRTTKLDAPDDIRRDAAAVRNWWGSDLDEHSRDGLFTLVIRAYLWRGVEGGPKENVDNFIRAAIKKTREIETTAPKFAAQLRASDEPIHRNADFFMTDYLDLARSTRYLAALRCLEENVPVDIGSPGGAAEGLQFYSMALARVSGDLELDDFNIPENTRNLAFRFGFCLSDVERVLRAEQAQAAPQQRTRAETLPAQKSAAEIFSKDGLDRYLLAFDDFYAQEQNRVSDEDRALVDVFTGGSSEPGSKGVLARQLVTAGYLWSRFDRLEPLDVRIDAGDRSQVVEATMQQYGISRAAASALAEAELLKRLLDEHPKDILKRRGQEQRFRQFRTQFVKDAVSDIFELLRGDPELVAFQQEGSFSTRSAEFQKEAEGLLAWGVAVGARRRLYEHDPSQARSLLS
ncbi:MAG: hypothetical protein MSC30_09855 [Gaiellaceae bacterium MAG52_C11]|nr:hypothetical protein [Candidatus Gaiellasilicea maunaloa]